MAQMKFSGSCLCGTVQYDLSGDPKHFYHCHCRRCRKATGTGHATNLMIASGGVNWIKGEASLTRYKVPDAERFSTCFCGICGSLLPRFVAELGVVVIPAGTLDSEPAGMPEARIFWDSRADWSCSTGDLAVYSEYPPTR